MYSLPSTEASEWLTIHQKCQKGGLSVKPAGSLTVGIKIKTSKNNFKKYFGKGHPNFWIIYKIKSWLQGKDLPLFRLSKEEHSIALWGLLETYRSIRT